MDKMGKYDAMHKVLRELEDIKNSETSVLKKIAQIEAENINYGFGLLDKSLPDVHDFSDKSIEAIDSIINDFTEFKNKFAKDNNLEEVEADTTEA
ncbi:MAG: hypothetical protein BGN92_00355 [Sphingobacteriales bacterium 41-5]|nr:MAG: hypothetical protein BGN92_00355 [Sphingobacteriales bacterium 41-5]